MSNPPVSVSAPRRVPGAAVAVWVMIALYIAYFGALTLQQHAAFQTTAFDLGNVDQAVWNTRHGRPFHMTNIEGLTNRLGTHVEPILLPVSLFYFLWSDPRTLLLLQTILIALGAWPVYLLVDLYVGRFTKRQDTHHILPLTFALVYLLFPALQSANTFDFHAVALAPVFFLFALYALERERWGWYALFALLTMACKEDMPLLVAMLGLYAIVVRRRWQAGLATIAVAAAWFLLAVGVIMPHFDTRGVSPLANRYAYLGDSPLEMALTMVTRPGLLLGQLRDVGALAYLRDLLAPVAYLPILAPQVLMLGLPPLLVNLLSTDGFMHQLEGFHYGVTLVPVAVVGAGYACAWLVGRFGRPTRGPLARALPLLLAVLVLVATVLYHRGHGQTPLARNWQALWPEGNLHHRLGEEMAGSIPGEASLAVLPYPNPHASQRQWLYMVDRLENGLPAPMQTADGSHAAEYAWFDVTNSWPLHPNDLKTGIDNLLLEEDFGVDQAIDGWLLLRRGAPYKDLPDAFYDFARAAGAQPRYPMRLQFFLDGEPALEALGFELDHNPRSGEYRLTFYWRALQPLPPGLHLYPFYVDDATGQILEDTDLRPMIASVWYPPDRWPVGEVVRTSTLPWPVGDDFSVGLGVVRGDDWQDTGRRLPIRVEASDLVVRLFDDDTWARLLQVQGGTPLEEWRQFEPDSLSPEHALDADLDRRVLLLGYDLARGKDGEQEITLYWQAQVRLDTSYTVFAQLLDEGGRVIVQADSVPQAGGYPTIWWLPGEIVVDRITLPPPVGDPGQRIIAGLYDPATGTRLPLVGSGTDSVELKAPAP